jgi:AcrR family transcriptional regulator
MGRKSSFTTGQVHTAVSNLLKTGQPVTIQNVAAEAKLSTGSLYHRFGSHQELLAEAWLDAVEAFQTLFSEALALGGRDGAVSVARFCTRHPDRARILSALPAPDQAHKTMSEDVSRRLRTVQSDSVNAVNAFAKAQGIAPELARLALVEVPLSVVRMYLPAKQVPAEAELWIARAYDGLMAAER